MSEDLCEQYYSIAYALHVLQLMIWGTIADDLYDFC